MFFLNEQDIYQYFKNLELRDLDSEIVNIAVYKVLYQFLEEQSEYIINKNQIDAFLKDTLNMTLYATNEEINTLVSYYDDEFLMIELGHKELEPIEIFNKFIVELKEILLSFLDQN